MQAGCVLLQQRPALCCILCPAIGRRFFSKRFSAAPVCRRLISSHNASFAPDCGLKGNETLAVGIIWLYWVFISHAHSSGSEETFCELHTLSSIFSNVWFLLHCKSLPKPDSTSSLSYQIYMRGLRLLQLHECIVGLFQINNKLKCTCLKVFY